MTTAKMLSNTINPTIDEIAMMSFLFPLALAAPSAAPARNPAPPLATILLRVKMERKVSKGQSL